MHLVRVDQYVALAHVSLLLLQVSLTRLSNLTKFSLHDTIAAVNAVAWHDYKLEALIIVGVFEAKELNLRRILIIETDEASFRIFLYLIQSFYLMGFNRIERVKVLVCAWVMLQLFVRMYTMGDSS